MGLTFFKLYILNHHVMNSLYSCGSNSKDSSNPNSLPCNLEKAINVTDYLVQLIRPLTERVIRHPT